MFLFHKSVEKYRRPKTFDQYFVLMVMFLNGIRYKV